MRALGWTGGGVPHASDLLELQAVEARDTAVPAERRADEVTE
jgi:hypothetical protein